MLAGTLALFTISCAQDTPTSASPRITEAGYSFGFCIGPCRGELHIDGEALALRVTDRTGSQVIAQNRGRLTSSGSARLAGVAASLPAELLETYGCPDCADGGAETLSATVGGAQRMVTFEYNARVEDLEPLLGRMRALVERLRPAPPE